VALGFERAEVTLSWWDLLVGRVRFHDVDFHRPALALRRGADGLIYLGDKPLNKAGPDDGAFTEWLLSQPRLGIHDATLSWRDEKSGARRSSSPTWKSRCAITLAGTRRPSPPCRLASSPGASTCAPT